MATWDYMTLTLGGGDELYTALASIVVGTTGVEWKRVWAGSEEEYVGGYLRHLPLSRTEPVVPIYPMETVDGSSGHTMHDVYASLWCVLEQDRVWIIDCSDSDPGKALHCANFPLEVICRGVSEEINRGSAVSRMTVNLAFADPH